jgi:hypothetical protein
MNVFRNEIGPFAVTIVRQLVNQHERLTANIANKTKRQNEDLWAATCCLTSIRGVIEAINKDKEVMLELRDIVFPVLEYGLTIDYEYSFEDCLAIIAMMVYHLSDPKVGMDKKYWRLFYYIIYAIAGD